MVRLLLAGLARTVGISLGLALALALALILFRDNSFVEAYRIAAYIVGFVLLVFSAVGQAPGVDTIRTPWRTYRAASADSGMRVNPSVLMLAGALVLFAVAIALE